MTSKGQITVPAEVRRDMGLSAGSQLEFVRDDDGTYRLVPAARSVRELKGVLSGTGRKLTVEEMEEVIAGAAANRRP